MYPTLVEMGEKKPLTGAMLMHKQKLGFRVFFCKSCLHSSLSATERAASVEDAVMES